MTIPTLCIIQARYHSTRLPGKMLLKLGDETLIARGYRIACEAFGKENVVVATPADIVSTPLADELKRIGAEVFHYEGAENDVLGRFHQCAHRYRWQPDTVLVRYTPDDPLKDVALLRRVAAGERLPVEIGGEAFTLAMLDAAHHRFLVRNRSMNDDAWEARVALCREHISHALFPNSPPPPCPPGDWWTVDTMEQLEAARRYLADRTAHETAPMVGQ